MVENPNLSLNNTPISPESGGSISKTSRIRWIDQARGFIVLYMVIFMFFQSDWVQGNAFFSFLFDHPSAEATYMNIYDVGASAFIFILGLLYGVSFWQHQAKSGGKKAVWHIVSRYGLIFLFGILIVLVDQGGFTEVKQLENGGDITVVLWDVMPTLGLVGFIAIPFLKLKPKPRILAAYLLLLFYQIMMVFDSVTLWRTFAIKSTNGGILGTIFSFSATLIIASSLGEYIYASQANKKECYMNFLKFGVVNFGLGLAISFISGWEASKRQVSLTYTMISIGFSILVAMLFILADEKYHKFAGVLDAFGKNPFLIYILGLVPEFIIYGLILENPEILVEVVIFIVMMVIISLVAVILYKKAKVISTEKTALWTIIIVGLLAAILLGSGLVEL